MFMPLQNEEVLYRTPANRAGRPFVLAKTKIIRLAQKGAVMRKVIESTIVSLDGVLGDPTRGHGLLSGKRWGPSIPSSSVFAPSSGTKHEEHIWGKR